MFAAFKHGGNMANSLKILYRLLYKLPFSGLERLSYDPSGHDPPRAGEPRGPPAGRGRCAHPAHHNPALAFPQATRSPGAHHDEPRTLVPSLLPTVLLMNRLAFTLPEVGLREVKGFVYVDDGYLVLEIQNALLGVLDVDKELIKIKPNALADLRIKRGLFVDRLVLMPKRPELLTLVPGDHRKTVDLRVWRKYRGELEDLIEDFEALKWA